MNNAERIRIFAGLKIAPEIAGELAQLAHPLERYPVRLIPPADIHLTLVPPWSEMSIPSAIEKLRQAAGRSAGFLLSFVHLRYGPTRRRPRLLWAECAFNDEIAALRTALLAAYEQRDERPFQPHVTLARIRANGPKVARETPMDQKLSFTQPVESVELFRSPPPGASGYQILASVPLGERRDSPPLRPPHGSD